MKTVLHLLSASGGGTERFVRDLAEGLSALRHLLLLFGPEGHAVLEDPLQGRRALLAGTASDRRRVLGLLDRYAVDLVHLHWVSTVTLPWMQVLRTAERGYLVSLHDIGFLRADAFDASADPLALDAGWVDAWRPIWHAAQVVTSPSGFIDAQWARLHTLREPVRVAPGLAEVTPVVEQALAENPTVGILGALGPHKGSEVMDAVLALAPSSGVRFVLIGYQDRQLYPGTLHDGQLTIHGPYLPAEAASLIDRYRIDLVWFPNQLPESFSYALSESWAAARPVLTPDTGALGERVAAHGGGWLLRAPADPASILADLLQHLPQARCPAYRAELRRERIRRVPTLELMLKTMQQIYEPLQSAVRLPEPWAEGELAEQLAEQVGPLRFRHENIRLARDYAQAREWITHLEADLQRLKVTRQEELLSLRLEIERRGDRIAQVEQWLADQACALQAEQANWQATLDRLQQQSEARQQHVEDLLAASALQHDIHAGQLAELQAQIAERDAHMAHYQQQLSALWTERAELAIKAHRYDQARRLIPGPLLRLARSLRSRLRGSR
ncbi:MAG: glycosyltransferase [Xanthomonadales bacterium]|jgi:glycosyltransferase involved in cell wall biosynthesis|nr:glycosyltransferase [Xanthomonadales bacterium]